MHVRLPLNLWVNLIEIFLPRLGFIEFQFEFSNGFFDYLFLETLQECLAPLWHQLLLHLQHLHWVLQHYSIWWLVSHILFFEIWFYILMNESIVYRVCCKKKVANRPPQYCAGKIASILAIGPTGVKRHHKLLFKKIHF